MHFKVVLKFNEMLIRMQTCRFTGSRRCKSCQFLKILYKLKSIFLRNRVKYLVDVNTSIKEYMGINVFCMSRPKCTISSHLECNGVYKNRGLK